MLLKLAKTMRPEVLLSVMVLVQMTVILGGYFYVLKSPLASHSRLSGEYERLTLMVGDKAVLEEQLLSAKRTLVEAKEKFDTSVRQPQTASSSTIISTISDTAAAREIDLLSVSPLPAQAVDFLSASTYRIEARGKFEQVSAWLQELASRFPTLVVSKLNMSPSADGAQITVTADVASYAVSEESSA